MFLAFWTPRVSLPYNIFVFPKYQKCISATNMTSGSGRLWERHWTWRMCSTPDCFSLTAHSSLRTTKRTTGWTYVQLAGTNKKESGPRYASRFFGSRFLACPLAKYSYPTLQLFKTNQHGSMCASGLYFKSMRYIKSTCLRSLDLSSAHNLPLFSKKALPKPDHHLSMCGWNKIKSTSILSHAS